MAKATHNFVLVNFTIDYGGLIGDLGARTLVIPGRKEELFEEHKMIFEAIKARNEKLAYEAELTHIHNVRRIIELLYVKRKETG